MYARCFIETLENYITVQTENKATPKRFCFGSRAQVLKRKTDSMSYAWITNPNVNADIHANSELYHSWDMR